MKLLEIQRQMKKRRNFREGNYSISVNLEHPGDEFQEFLKVKITENNKLVAKAIFKQWAGKSKWEPLSITVENPQLKVTLREMMYNAAANAGFFIKD
jgi:hypothetical protein